MGRVFDFPEPRNSHVNITEIRTRRPRINPRHPSLYEPPAMFDQEADANAADRCVVLTKIEAAHIATLLNVARAHLPSPKAVDQCIAILTGKRR